MSAQASQPYGAIELKSNYQKYLKRGLLFATVFHFIGVGVYWGSIYLGEEDEPTIMVRVIKYSELGPPPSIANSNLAPAIAVSGPAVKPSIGIPVPVPDTEVDPAQTIATQTELSQAVGPVTGAETGAVSGDIQIEDDSPPPDFVPFEKEPQVIKSVKPVYPEIAKRAGVEGTVFLKLWVDKEGKVRKAVVLKTDADLFNQPAIDAAMQFVFTPAMQHAGPVSVWVSIPFRFNLKGQ